MSSRTPIKKPSSWGQNKDFKVVWMIAMLLNLHRTSSSRSSLLPAPTNRDLKKKKNPTVPPDIQNHIGLNKLNSDNEQSQFVGFMTIRKVYAPFYSRFFCSDSVWGKNAFWVSLHHRINMEIAVTWFGKYAKIVLLPSADTVGLGLTLLARCSC